MTTINHTMQPETQITQLIIKEEERQARQLRMIPSENYVSAAVRNAVGSVLMNKYSEGQAFKRYYQGNIHIDQIEEIVKNRALELFKLDPAEWGVNVQAVTGSIANLAVYTALLKPGDKIMGMFLYDGGHLSHGWKLPPDNKYPTGKPVSFTSQIYQPVHYYVNAETRIFDYDEIEKVALQNNPQIIISGGTAYPREINHQRLHEIARKCGAYYMADIAHEAGLVAAGKNSSPFAYADVVTMTTRKTLRGPIGAIIFARSVFIDAINSAVFPGLQGGPQNHSIAVIGVALHEAMQPEFIDYAEQVIKNAQMLATELAKHGFDICSGGTDKHLVLIDLRNRNVSGKDAAVALERANIIVNKNTVPGEDNKPWNPSGIRLGTPALTTRGMKEPEMVQIANWIDEVITNSQNEEVIRKIGTQVTTLTEKFPLP